MSTGETRGLQPGDRAPAFTLPALNREGPVSLEEFRGRSAVLLGLFRGLHCPFCRRHIVQLGAVHRRLQEAGVETVAVVNTRPERGRLYFQYRPTPVVLAADPDAVTHRAFGVPEVKLVPDEARAGTRWPVTTTHAELLAARINPTGELAEAKNPIEAMRVLNAREGFEPTEIDKQVAAEHGVLLSGQFLIDRGGIVRWTFVEAQNRIDDIAKYPADEDVLAAVRALSS